MDAMRTESENKRCYWRAGGMCECVSKGSVAWGAFNCLVCISLSCRKRRVQCLCCLVKSKRLPLAFSPRGHRHENSATCSVKTIAMKRRWWCRVGRRALVAAARMAAEIEDQEKNQGKSVETYYQTADASQAYIHPIVAHHDSGSDQRSNTQHTH